MYIFLLFIWKPNKKTSIININYYYLILEIK